MSYLTQIQDYVSGFSDTTAADKWLTYGAKRIVDLLPLHKAEKFSADLTAGGSGVDTTGHRVVSANKVGYAARKVSEGLRSQAADAGSIYYASAQDPVYYELNGKGYVLPTPGTIVGMAYPTVANTATSISKFPSEYEDGVVLYAAIRAVTQEIDTITALDDEDIELTEETLKVLSTQRQGMETDYKEILAQVAGG